MKHLAFCCLLLLLRVAAAQSFSAPWDVSETAKALAAQVDKLAPILEELKPEEWQAKGAPAVYKDQVQAARNEIGYLAAAARSFEKNPDRLTLALQTFFRMQAVEGQVGSLVEAVNKYQTPQLGDRLRAAVIENSTNRDQLRRYIGDLAETREQEIRVIDQEAQRCRDLLVRTPPVTGPASRPASIPNPARNTSSSTPVNSSVTSPAVVNPSISPANSSPKSKQRK
jgi:hypothetical protein